MYKGYEVASIQCRGDTFYRTANDLFYNIQEHFEIDCTLRNFMIYEVIFRLLSTCV